MQRLTGVLKRGNATSALRLDEVVHDNFIL